MVDLPLEESTTFGLHTRIPDPDYARDLVALVEETGMTTLAVGDHLAFAQPIDDSLMGLAMVATLSKKITIATSVYLLPLRHPGLVAKQTNTLARMAPGRFIFGVGVGGEVQLTDALDELLKLEELNAFKTDASIFDCGNKQGFLSANLAVGMRDPGTKQYLNALIEAADD